MDNKETTNPLDFILEIAQGKAVIVDGNVSKQCVQELHKAYAKIDPNKVKDEEAVATESQANDALTQAGMWQALLEQKQKLLDQGYVVGLLYGVNKNQVGMSDIIKVTEYLDTLTEPQKQASAIYIDERIDEHNQAETFSNMKELALEAILNLAKKQTIPVFTNMSDVKAYFGEQ